MSIDNSAVVNPPTSDAIVVNQQHTRAPTTVMSDDAVPNRGSVLRDSRSVDRAAGVDTKQLNTEYKLSLKLLME